MSKTYDAVVVGSGPNGLSAAIRLAQGGARVLVLEARETPGGGMRSDDTLTLPGFVHDVCSAVHPTGILSPYWRTLGLEAHGLEWMSSGISVAHPLEGEPAALLMKSVEETGETLGRDAKRYARLMRPLLGNPHGLFGDALGPLGLPKHPLLLARFGLSAAWPATWFAKLAFREHRARALFAGSAAHSILPLNFLLTSALGVMFSVMGHVEDWPVARGGSQAITDALVRALEALGGEVRCGVWVKRPGDLPPARAYLFDTSPRGLTDVLGERLPGWYRRRLSRYVYGPGVFKIDYALSEAIPWSDPACATASTVHVGGTIEEIHASEAAAWRGDHAERPFVLVCQQSALDPGRAPQGQHTGYAYCHVPHGSARDMTAAIEAQIERFAPGFRDVVLARHVMDCADFERYNPNDVGGVITGGAANLTQLFTRPLMQWDPYRTAHPRVWLCSASTPPGGGVHGMCGYHSAESALRRLDDLEIAPL